MWNFLDDADSQSKLFDLSEGQQLFGTMTAFIS